MVSRAGFALALGLGTSGIEARAQPSVSGAFEGSRERKKRTQALEQEARAVFSL